MGGIAAAIDATPRWVLLLLVAVAARAIGFANPILHVDEEFYFVTAHMMAEGALPYVDVWDRKPIGLFLIYYPAGALGYPYGIWLYQAMALACAVLTSVMIARFADRAGWRRGSLLAAIAYLVWLNLFEGEGGQAPVFYNLLTIAAAWLIAPDPARDRSAVQRMTRGLIAMALLGLAMQVKYTALFEGLFFGLWLMWREWRITRSAARVLVSASLWAGVALIPTAAALAAYVAIGHGEAFFYANFVSILERRPDSTLEQLGNLAVIVLVASPLFAMALLARGERRAVPQRRGIQNWLFAWLAASVAGLLGFGSYFDHYALPLLVPASICAAGFIGEHRHGKRLAAIFLVLGFVGGQALLTAKWIGRGSPAQFAEVTRAVGHGPGCLYVYSGNPMLYVSSGRCAETRYRFPDHLPRARERGSIGIDQQHEILRILAAKPEIVVLREPYRGERPELRAMVSMLVRREYRLKALPRLGNQDIEVWERR